MINLTRLIEGLTGDVVKDFAKDFIKHEVTKGIMYVVVTLGLGWYTALHVEGVHNAVLKDSEKNMVEENKRLTSQLSVTKTVQSIVPQVLKDAVKAALAEAPRSFDGRALQSRIDSMARENKRLTEVVSSLVNVNLAGGRLDHPESFRGRFFDGGFRAGLDEI